MPRRTLVTAGLIVGCAFGVSRLHLREAGRSNDWNNVAGAFEVEGDRIAAVATPRRSLAEEPDDGPVLVRLARLVLDDSRPEEALELLRRAERDARTQWIAGIPAVYVYVLLGRADLAEQAGAILVDKPMPDARLRAELLANLALAADAVGHHAIARDRLRAAEAIDPSSSAVERARRNIAE